MARMAQAIAIPGICGPQLEDDVREICSHKVNGTGHGVGERPIMEG